MPSPIFVMPRDPANWGGAAALWVTVAGWAGAARRLGDTPIILTPSSVLTDAECLQATALAASPPRTSTSRIPAPIRQGLRDGQRAVNMRAYNRGAADSPALRGVSPSFVWQHHELFHRAGEGVARRHDVPLIEYVHAPVVWEARRWGVTRPGWGGLVVRTGERPQLRRADLVACVSDEVATEVIRLGVDPGRVIVSPMGVDPERFSPDVDSNAWRERFHDLGDFVFGWVGSFRKFHAIDLALDALADLRQEGHRMGLVLAGDGQDRPRLQARVAELGLSASVRFVGQVNNTEMPALLGALDAAVITAAAGQEFHYSPLKLREYLAMAVPVVVPRIGEMARLLTDGDTGMLYEAGDATDLGRALLQLADDGALRERVAASGRDLLLRTGTWDAIVAEATKRLKI